MNINATQPASLEAFLKLVHSARVRNGGFDVPMGKMSAAASQRAGTAAAPHIKAAGNIAPSYRAPATGSAIQPAKPKQVLGTLFDAYA